MLNVEEYCDARVAMTLLDALFELYLSFRSSTEEHTVQPLSREPLHIPLQSFSVVNCKNQLSLKKVLTYKIQAIHSFYNSQAVEETAVK